MNRTASLLLALAAILSGCASAPKATTPIPDEIFTAVGYYRHTTGSVQVATEEANKFCKHWRAKAGVLTSETVDLRKEGTVADAAKETAKRVIETGWLFDRGLPIQTTITYKCY